MPRRRRCRLFLAMVSTLGSGRVDSVADLLRAFTFQNGETVAYKVFYNRVARAGYLRGLKENVTMGPFHPGRHRRPCLSRRRHPRRLSSRR